MCGIAGAFAYDARAPRVDREQIRRSCDWMACRGPDGDGIWTSDDGRAVLGHRRLAIIDLSPRGAQPMVSADGRYVISFNGEIYNYRALRAQLEQQGRRFVSDSDTEVLLHLYAVKGESMVADLRGMFAFAIWDNVRHELFLARDAFGIKPLYYADDGRTIRFASEVKALLAGSRAAIDTNPEPAGHVGFYLWGSVPEPFTLYAGIRALPAGAALRVTPGVAQSPSTYADLTALFTKTQGERHPPMDEHAIREELRAAVLDSVRHHMISDVPVGVFLSAGLDSTTIAALASEAGPRLRTLTLGFEEYRGTPQDEVPLAEVVARQYGAEHRTVWVTRAEFNAELDRLLDRMDQPSTDGVNAYFVAKAASSAGLKVALSGLGGDELFGGYPSFRQVPRLASMIPRGVWARRIGQLARMMTAPVIRGIASPKFAGILEYGGDYGGAYLLRRAMFLPWEISAVLAPDFAQAGYAALQANARTRPEDRSLRSAHLQVTTLEAKHYMRNQLLRDADWASMSHSLELRVPFVDSVLWERVARIHARARAVTKHDMARSPAHPLPAALLRRAKTGFSIPTREWLVSSTRSSRAVRGLRGWATYVHTRFLDRYSDTQRSARLGGNTVARRRGAHIRAVVARACSAALGDLIAKPFRREGIGKILVMQLQQLGDSQMFTPVLRAVRQAYPEARIDLLANGVSARLYDKSPHLDDVILTEMPESRRRALGRWLGVLRRVRRERYDVVIADVTQRALRYSLISFATGARARVGFDEDGKGFLFTSRIPYRAHQSVLDANMEIAARLGAPTDDNSLESYFDDADVEHVAGLLKGTASDRPLVALHPASNWQSKTWRVDRWAHVADVLVRDHGCEVIFIGAAREATMVDDIRAQMREPARTLVGATTLAQLGALLSRVRLCIGTDSGPRHIAAAVGCPQLTLMSAHDLPERWQFGRANEVVLRTQTWCSPCFRSTCAHQTCMLAISTDAVLETCARLLGSATPAPPSTRPQMVLA